MPCFSYYLLYFLFNKTREQEEEQILPGITGEQGNGRKVAQTMYTHVSNVKTIKKKSQKGAKI
jgi:hypothetical protein